jgi:TusA-related sulfurtransferase
MKTKKTLTDMQVGQVLRVVATDSGSVHDMLAFTKKAGHEMLEQQNVGKDYIHLIRRG